VEQNNIITPIFSCDACSGKVPPNTPSQYIDEMKSINFLKSKKFFVVFTSIIMLLAFYGISVFILFLTAKIPTITFPFVTYL
jgi:hypothetical protein